MRRLPKGQPGPVGQGGSGVPQAEEWQVQSGDQCLQGHRIQGRSHRSPSKGGPAVRGVGKKVPVRPCC